MAFLIDPQTPGGRIRGLGFRANKARRAFALAARLRGPVMRRGGL